MNRSLPLILLLLLAYIATPLMLNWVTDPKGVWYKPFIIWLAVIVVAFIVERRASHDDT